MPYRDEDALDRRARQVEALAQNDLDTAAREAIEADIAAADRARRAVARRHLPLVAQARIASPCSEIWEAMLGDGPVRACTRCDEEVFDLGAMTLADAEALLRRRVGEATCVRLHQRRDGTMMFADCQVGANGVRARRFGVALASIAIGASALAATASLQTHHHRHASVLAWPSEAHEDALSESTTSYVMGQMQSFPVSPAFAADAPPPGAPGYILTSPPRRPPHDR